MDSKWSSVKTSEGTTDSERYLVKLGKKAFLSLWSYPNLHTDEGRRGKGDGNELCDLLVVFGNDIIIFSDKACAFSDHSDIKVAWYRWYRGAVRKSAKQLIGAESWLKRFPDRVYIDKACQTKLPMTLPRPAEARIHLVAVTHGSVKPAEKYWGGGSSGSLLIHTELIGEQHKDVPFCVGWPVHNKRFVHVLDEMTLDLLMNELDTISDFVTYLRKKEELISNHGAEFLILGEEELLANYLNHYDFNKKEHHFQKFPKADLIHIGEGDWHKFKHGRAYAAKREANAVSYLWDNLIEFQNFHIIHGAAESIYGEYSDDTQEKVMRILASENRVKRRSLGEAVQLANSHVVENMRFTRTVMNRNKQGRAYVLMSISKPEGMTREDYLEMRRDELNAYVIGCKIHNEDISEVIGIVLEPGQDFLHSVDFLYIGYGEGPMDNVLSAQIQPFLNKYKMWDKGAIKTTVDKNLPYPALKSPLLKLKFWVKNFMKI